MREPGSFHGTQPRMTGTSCHVDGQRVEALMAITRREQARNRQPSAGPDLQRVLSHDALRGFEWESGTAEAAARNCTFWVRRSSAFSSRPARSRPDRRVRFHSHREAELLLDRREPLGPRHLPRAGSPNRSTLTGGTRGVEGSCRAVRHRAPVSSRPAPPVVVPEAEVAPSARAMDPWTSDTVSRRGRGSPHGRQRGTRRRCGERLPDPVGLAEFAPDCHGSARTSATRRASVDRVDEQLGREIAARETRERPSERDPPTSGAPGVPSADAAVMW
jgi:hypothetical protein